VLIVARGLKKGSPMHVAPSYVGSGEGPDHFVSYI
jgi:hypothetical protein